MLNRIASNPQVCHGQYMMRMMMSYGKLRKRMTFDLDFADVRIYAPGNNTGTIVFRTRSTTSRTIKEFSREYFE